MREKHPIDELFGRALSDAEATPPAAVWEGVVHRRHWGHRLLLQMERKWGWAVLLLLLLGTPIIWLAAQGGSAGEVGGAATKAPVLQAEANAAVLQVNTVMPVEMKDPVSARPLTDVEKGAVPNPVHDAFENLSGNGSRSHSPKTDKASSTSLSNSSVNNGGSEKTGPTELPPGVALNDVMIASNDEPPTPMTDDYRDAAFVLAPTQTRPIGLHRGDGSLEIEPTGKEQDAIYVLGKGNWFLGIRGGIADLRGSWTGHGALVEVLNEDEEWRGQRSIGLYGGFRWNDGWSLGAGVGYTARTSRFLHNTTGPDAVSNVVDTTWSGTAAGPDTYFTWNIDTLMHVEPGAEQQFSTTNNYGLLQFPVHVGKQWAWARWTFELRGGALLGTTVRRDGRTLAVTGTIPGDSTTAAVEVIDVVDAGNGSVSDRFGFSMALFMGADLGYRLSSRLSARVGPSYGKDVLGGRDTRLRTSQLGALLGIEYEFRARERRTQLEAR